MSNRSDKRGRGPKGGKGPKVPFGRWLAGQMIDLIRRFGTHLMWGGVVVYLIHTAGETLRAFAGQTSIANLVVSLAAHANVTVAISLSLSGITSALWGWEYRRHRKTRERLTARITHLEKMIDPKRASSQLTTEGTTRIGDL